MSDRFATSLFRLLGVLGLACALTYALIGVAAPALFFRSLPADTPNPALPMVGMAAIGAAVSGLLLLLSRPLGRFVAAGEGAPSKGREEAPHTQVSIRAGDARSAR
ncbi:MAG: hypothetical protein U1F36_03195 [Planctomycetota bacterium]